MKYDSIIIGGGLGGLFAGAKLAKEGKKILLLEQHDRPGGCATTFNRKDYTMEVGLHEMDGLHPSDGKMKIFEDLGIFEDVTFLEVPEFYRFCHGTTDLVMPHDRNAATEMLKTRFPKEAKGIDAYFERLMNARRINIMERNTPDVSIGEYLDRLFKDEEIKLVLLGNLGYFHDDPYSLSLKYFSIAEGSYFNGRANFIQGGSQKLSDKLVSIIREYNGSVLLHHQVTRIKAEKSRIEHITFKNIMPGDHPEIHASAEEYIANAALPEIARMIEGSVGENLVSECNNLAIGASLLTVYYGFGKSLKELGHQHYSTFLFDESIQSQKDILPNNKGDFTKRSFTFVDYSQIDAQLAPAGKSVGAICCIDYLEDWEGLDKAEYRKKKQEAQDALTTRLIKLIPGCENYIEHVETGTAKTVKRYTLNPGGAVYGFAQVPDKPVIKSISEIENLSVASAWGKFGGGFSGAIYSGYMTAMDLLRKK